MELLRFILSDFWVWTGFIFLAGVALSALYCVINGLVDLVKACKRNRNVTCVRIGGQWHVTIENATEEEAHSALISATYARDRDEETDTGRDDQ